MKKGLEYIGDIIIITFNEDDDWSMILVQINHKHNLDKGSRNKQTNKPKDIDYHQIYMSCVSVCVCVCGYNKYTY